MGKLACSACKKVYEESREGKCPHCGSAPPIAYDFTNSDAYLSEKVSEVRDWRRSVGLEGLVGGLESVIISTEPERQQRAAEELLHFTGLEFHEAFQDEGSRTCVLKGRNSSDFLITSRRRRENPFKIFNRSPKAGTLPNTRLETFVFKTTNIEKYVSLQKSAGVRFLNDEIMQEESFSFVQTEPSVYTGGSVGLIQWKKDRRDYSTKDSVSLDWQLLKPENDYLKDIGELDHAATRVRARDRDAAIIEFMSLTNYDFDFAIYVKLFNSITNVARLTEKDFAMVFTSGISPYMSDGKSGPTEKFIHNYGTRVHHIAFNTENIEKTFAALKEGGMDFLIGLVGSQEEGLKQSFSVASPHTLLVSEYIHRYGDFDGFFTKSNVTLLTEATGKQ